MTEKKKYIITAKDTFVGSAGFQIEADGFEYSITNGRLEVFNKIEGSDGEIRHEVIASFTPDHSIYTYTPQKSSTLR